MKKKGTRGRLAYIDNLRGLAILFMIFLHTGVYYTAKPLVHVLFNAADFVNVAFLFCSSYVFFEKNDNSHELMNRYTIKKRLVRLVVPYYIFLAFYFSLVYFLERKSFNLENIIKHIVMWNGIYVSWLVLLFIIFFLLNPIILLLRMKNRLLYKTVFVISLMSSIIFLLLKVENYAYILWIPYILTIYFVIWLRKIMNNYKLLLITLLSLNILFIPLYIIKGYQSEATLLANKYPPNLYYMLYSFIVITFLFMVRKFVIAKENVFSTYLTYLGKYSYDIFFIHILLIYVLSKFAFFAYGNFIISFILVLLLSSVVQLTMRFLYVKFVKIGDTVKNIGLTL